MPYKDLEVRKAYHKEQSRKHYEANRKEIIKKAGDKKKEFRAEWQEYKATLSCTKCGFSHPAALDFHHEDPTKKEANIHRLLSNGQYDKLKKELKKCIVLCANCHRVHHYNEKMLNSLQ
jgi:predicted nucleic-acid-binding Zn-ribbon protein